MDFSFRESEIQFSKHLVKLLTQKRWQFYEFFLDRMYLWLPTVIYYAQIKDGALGRIYKYSPFSFSIFSSDDEDTAFTDSRAYPYLAILNLSGKYNLVRYANYAPLVIYRDFKRHTVFDGITKFIEEHAPNHNDFIFLSLDYNDRKTDLFSGCYVFEIDYIMLRTKNISEWLPFLQKFYKAHFHVMKIEF